MAIRFWSISMFEELCADRPGGSQEAYPTSMVIRLALFLLAACGCFAQDVARMEQVIQSYTAKQQFMGSVLVAKGTEVVLNKGYGSANLELDVPNSPATKFRLGSITKQFTAASILLLQERGKLNIQDPVKKYVGCFGCVGQGNHFPRADAHFWDSEFHQFSRVRQMGTVRGDTGGGGGLV